MKKYLDNNIIKMLYKNKMLFVKYLRDNPNTDIPIPDDVQIPEDLIYDEYTIPWIGILYYSPRIDVNDEVIIPFNCTDFYQCDYRYDIYKEYTLRWELDGQVGYKKIKAGENEINFGKLSEGIHYYTLEVEDWNGLKSRRLANDIWIYNKSEYTSNLSSSVYTITQQDLLDHNITINLDGTATADQMKNNRCGLSQLFLDIKAKGYKKCILPNAVYRVNRAIRLGTIANGDTCIDIPSNFTVDMNGSTFKLHEYSDAEYGSVASVENLLVRMFNCEDSHIENGTFEGDYFERQENGWISGSNGEHNNTFYFYGGRFNSLENITIKQTTGYNVCTGQAGGSGAREESYSWQDNIAIDRTTGQEYEKQGWTTSTMAKLKDIALTEKYIVTSVWLAMGGLAGTYWDMDYHFYDENQEHIESFIAYQFTRVRIPDNAKYIRRTFRCLSSELGSKGGTHHMNVARYCEINNCTWIDNRTCCAPFQHQHLLINNCTFTRSGQSITPCEIDLEDGWEQQQDTFIRNCEIFEHPGTGSLIDNSGLNHVFENNKNWPNIIFRYRINGITVKNNENCGIGISIGWMTGNTVKVFNNKNITFNLSSADEYFFNYEKVYCPARHNEISGIGGASKFTALENNTVEVPGGFVGQMRTINCDVYMNGTSGNRNYLYELDFENCNFYLSETGKDKTYIQMDGNKEDAKRTFKNCVFHNDVVWTFYYYNSFNHVDCEFKGTFTMDNVSKMESKCTGQMQFNNCIFQGKVTITIDAEKRFVEFNNCTFNGGYEFKGTYGQTNCIINDTVPTDLQYVNIKNINEGNYLKLNTTVSYSYDALPFTAINNKVSFSDSNNLVNFSIDENGNNWLTPVKVGPTDLTIIGENGVTNILPVIIVDIDYVYGRLSTTNTIGGVVGNYTNNRYDTVVGGSTYKFSTESYVKTITILELDANDQVVASHFMETPVTASLANGDTEYSLTITLNANTVKTRSSFGLQNSASTNMNKVFGTYKVTKL